MEAGGQPGAADARRPCSPSSTPSPSPSRSSRTRRAAKKRCPTACGNFLLGTATCRGDRSPGRAGSHRRPRPGALQPAARRTRPEQRTALPPGSPRRNSALGVLCPRAACPSWGQRAAPWFSGADHGSVTVSLPWGDGVSLAARTVPPDGPDTTLVDEDVADAIDAIELGGGRWSGYALVRSAARWCGQSSNEPCGDGHTFPWTDWPPPTTT